MIICVIEMVCRYSQVIAFVLKKRNKSIIMIIKKNSQAIFVIIRTSTVCIRKQRGRKESGDDADGPSLIARLQAEEKVVIADFAMKAVSIIIIISGRLREEIARRSAITYPNASRAEKILACRR